MPGPRPARPVRSVWELTAYTNGYVFLTGCFSGELHLPIRQLGVSYGLISLAELPPPDTHRDTSVLCCVEAVRGGAMLC